MSEDRKFKWVGTRPIRHDGYDKVTGRANFGADFTLPGMLHGKVVRSPHAHARILSIDCSAALAIAGVKAIITDEDLPLYIDPSPGYYNLTDICINVLAHGKALYEGHAIAAVAATTAEIAQQAVDSIVVNYEVLPHVLDIDAALDKDAPIINEDLRTQGRESNAPTNLAAVREIGRGDIKQGFAQADAIVEREFTTQRVHQGYIEPHAVVARMGVDERSTIWVSTQGPFNIRKACAALCEVDHTSIKVIPAEIGGGFGGKTTVYLEPLALALARKSGRPVKMVMDRDEVFRATGPTSDTKVRVKIGATRDGKMVAAEAELFYEGGAFKGSHVGAGGNVILAPYDIPNARIVGHDVLVNKSKICAYRAPGAPMAVFASESVIDELAEKIGIDPLEFRARNGVKEGTHSVYGPVFKRIGMYEVLEAMRSHPHYSAPLGENQGRGVALGFWFNAGNQSSASIHVNEDGGVSVIEGCPDIGGSRAAMALVTAEELQIPVDCIQPIVGDTETSAYCDGTGGSRVTYATSLAVIEAAQDVIRQLRERASLLWSCELDDVAWEDGKAIPLNGASDNEPLTLREIAKNAQQTGGPIASTRSINATSPGPAFAGHVVDVEVDKETGRVDVLRYTAIQDVGKAVHPDYVEGQIQGGAVQGIGWALNEAYMYDEQGKLENPAFLDYRMPVASDVPMIDTVIIEVPNPGHPYGIRGVGEAPIVPPLAAIANAVHNATGVRMTDLPLSPPRVLEALDSA